MTERVIRVDLTKVKAQLLASVPHKADVDRILKGLGAATMHYWKSLAQKELRSTARDYIQALSHREEPGKVARIGGEGVPGHAALERQPG